MTENRERVAEVKLRLSCDCHEDTGEVRVEVYIHTVIPRLTSDPANEFFS